MNYVKNKSTLVAGDVLLDAKDIYSFKGAFIIIDIDFNDGIVYMKHQNEDQKTYATSYKYLHIEKKFYDPESKTICKISNM